MKQLLTCVMDVGEHMLTSGAEIHRVEESVDRMCRACGAVRVDVFIITSSMVVTVFDADDHAYTQTRRITAYTTNFEKIHRLNALSRRICAEKLPPETVRQELQSIANCKAYPFWLECLCYSVIAGAFTLFFGGNLQEMLVSLVVGLLVRLATSVCELAISNKIFSKFFSAALATAMAILAVRLGWIGSIDKIIIGNIMSLIPGIGLTNALRDLFTGDSIAGLLRSIEAALTALAIAAGYFLVSVLGGIV